MAKLDFKTRLQLISAGIDFLLDHPKLKCVDFTAGIMILRQTVLFGKLSDTMTLAQLSGGVRNLNRGTGRSKRRLSLAVSNLREVHFVRVEKATCSWHGRTLTLCADEILCHVHMLRQPAEGEACETKSDVDFGPPAPCPKQGLDTAVMRAVASQYASLNLTTGNTSRRQPPEDVASLRTMLVEMTRQLRVSLPEVDLSTCRNLLACARAWKADATPDDVVWFLRDEFVDSPTRFRTWGGPVFIVRAAFGAARR